MSMHLIDGKKIAAKIEDEIRKAITPPAPSYLKRGEVGLAAVLVGNNPASRLYVSLKEKAAKRVGIKFIKILYPISNFHPPAGRSISNMKKLEQKIIKKIHQLNNDKIIAGIIVQLPLPKGLNTNKIITAIDPKKDADGFHPKNQKSAISPVLQATIEILKSIKSPSIPLLQREKKMSPSLFQREDGRNLSIVLVSNSKIFPIPFQSYFGKNLTVCKFKDIKKCLASADIIITAIGKKHYLKAGLVKNGTIIIDVGIVREGKKVYGDADPESLTKKRGWLTPVPGGVGPVTVACLLKNTAKINSTTLA